MKKIYTVFIAAAICCHSFAQWNPNTAINLEAAGLRSADIHAASTSDGRTYIAYYQQNSGGNYDMRAQFLDQQGNKLFGNDGVLVSAYTSGSATFVFNVDVDNENNFIIAFQDQRSGSNGAVIHKVNPEGGLVWGAAGVVLGAGLSPYPAVLSNNDVIVAWNNNNRISMQKISAAGVMAWGTPIEILPPVTGRAISRGQIVSLTNNTFGIVFQQRTGTVGSPTPTNLYEQKFDANGTALWAAPVQISNYVTSNARYFSVIADADTTFVGYYANPPAQNRFDAFLQRVNADGTMPWGINGSSFSNENVNYEMTTNLAFSAGSSQIWETATYSNTNQTQYGIYAQRFNKLDGSRQLTDNAKSLYPISSNSEQLLGSLSMFGDDPVFAFYDISNKLFASRINSNGDFVWAPQKTELASTANTKFRYSFTRAVNGQAVAVWQENRGTEDRPYAQNINAAGATGTIPVTLVSFAGKLKNNTIELNWQTASEINCKGFYVEKSGNGRGFESIGFTGSKAVNGVSNLPLSYLLKDEKPFTGNNYYRLRQVDLDGQINYSNSILIRYNGKGLALGIYPNPSSGILYADIQSASAAGASIVISDAQGKTIRQQNIQLLNGTQHIAIDIRNLSSGTYIFRLVSKETEPVVMKFQKGS